MERRRCWLNPSMGWRGWMPELSMGSSALKIMWFLICNHQGTTTPRAKLRMFSSGKKHTVLPLASTSASGISLRDGSFTFFAHSRTSSRSAPSRSQMTNSQALVLPSSALELLPNMVPLPKTCRLVLAVLPHSFQMKPLLSLGLRTRTNHRSLSDPDTFLGTTDLCCLFTTA